MNKLLIGFPLLLLGACAATGDQSTMSAAELGECLQPNRRVMVEAVGVVAKPPAKKPAAKPQTAAAPKPQVAAAKPAADAPPAKPKKPAMMAFQQALYVQGNTAFDPNSAVLKEGGQKQIDGLMALLKKRAVQVNAIIIAGHTDRLEASAGKKTLSEERAKAVKDYLTSSGMNEKIMFWEGKEAREPVAVTKFCT